MSSNTVPSTVEELSTSMRECGESGRSVELGGAFSKSRMGGPVAEADVRLSTVKLDRLLAYEPADLTVSVEAGMPYRQLKATLADNHQILPLDPPFSDQATIGGILATNTSGPRRRRYGTARDMLIGAQFATLEGKLVKSGGMVVKNVTGLDMGKLLIGSYGTLGAMATANFKVFPAPQEAVTIAFISGDVAKLLELRRVILGGALQPNAIDWLNPAAARSIGLPSAHNLLLQAAGSAATVARYRQEYLGLRTADVAAESLEEDTWDRVRELGPSWLEAHRAGAIVRVSLTATRLGELLGVAEELDCPALVRAGNGVAYLPVEQTGAARELLTRLRGAGFVAVVEAGSLEVRRQLELWQAPAVELELMKRLKADFDPHHLLNRGRLFGLL